MNRLSIAALGILASIAAACSQAPAEAPSLGGSAWTLDGSASELSYVTIKADTIGEANKFEGLSGSVSADGAAEITIDLASVSTGIDIRNQRMRDILFVVADNPTASVTANLDPAAFEAMGLGESIETTIDGTLTLKGVEAPFRADVTVTRTGADSVLAVSDAPVILDAELLGLGEGLAELQSLASLPSISPVVPVSFALTFTR